MKTFLFAHRRSLLGLGLIAALGTGAYAVAQPAPPRPPSARMVEDRDALREEHLARRHAMRQHFEETREARFEGQLAYLKTRLRITDEQTPLWENFAATLRTNMEERGAARPAPRGQGAAPPSLLERLEAEQARIARRADHLSATAQSLVPLYNSFDDQQKQIADRVLGHAGDARMAMRDRPGRPGGQRGTNRGRGERFDGPPFEEPIFDERLDESEPNGEPQRL